MAQPQTERTKCDVVRTFINRTVQGYCSACDPKCTDPTMCSTTCYDATKSRAPGYCGVGSLAARYDQAFNDKYAPAGFFTATGRTIRTREMQIDASAIGDLTSSLQKEFPNVPADQLGITWNDIAMCKWNAQGTPGGADQAVYPTRNELELMGYRENPLVGAKTLIGKVPSWSTKMVPIWMDRIFTPELAVIVIFVLLVIIFAALIYGAYSWSRGAPARAAIARTKELIEHEKTDPYRGTAFESWPDPNKRIRHYIEAQEAAGYDMAAYRRQYSLPPRGA